MFNKLNIVLQKPSSKKDLEYFVKGSFRKSEESQKRIDVIERMIAQSDFNKEFSFEIEHSLNPVTKTHDLALLNRIKLHSSSDNQDRFWVDNEFDWSYGIERISCTPFFRGIFDFAKSSVDASLTGADLLKNKEKLVYVLNRPPGHHAEKAKIGGFCYFNNVAIVANYLKNYGKIAILDFDVHHGNGTQQIFYKRNDVLYLSIHESPHEYPKKCGYAHETGFGKGKGFNFNFPLPYNSDWGSYVNPLKRCIKIIREYTPSVLLISAGYDAVDGDIVGNLKLKPSDYKTVGHMIASLNLPTLIVQEGGYTPEKNAECALNFVSGLLTNSS